MEIQPFLIGYSLPVTNPHVESWTSTRVADSWTAIAAMSYYEVRSGDALSPENWLPRGRSSLYYNASNFAASQGAFLDYSISSAAFPFLYDTSTHSIAAALRLWPGTGHSVGGYSDFIRVYVGSFACDGKSVESFHAWQQSCARFNLREPRLCG